MLSCIQWGGEGELSSGWLENIDDQGSERCIIV